GALGQRGLAHPRQIDAPPPGERQHPKPVPPARVRGGNDHVLVELGRGGADRPTAEPQHGPGESGTKAATRFGSPLEAIVKADQMPELPLFSPHRSCGSTRRSAPPCPRTRSKVMDLSLIWTR